MTIIFNESKVPKYTLPNPLLFLNGTMVTTKKAWNTHRKSEILKLFEQYVYGKMPSKPEKISFKTTSFYLY